MSDNSNTRTIGIIMNGVTGRMGTNQHLLRSIAAIRQQGGVKTPSGLIIYPEPVLVGRNPAKLEALCKKTGIERMTTNLDEVLADDFYEIYFDAQITGRRYESVKKRSKQVKIFTVKNLPALPPKKLSIFTGSPKQPGLNMV